MHLSLAIVLLALPSIDEKYIHLLFRFLWTWNDKGKEYKTLFQAFVGRQIIRHDENRLTRIWTTNSAVRMETIR
jgi:hypothetical protein